MIRGVPQRFLFPSTQFHCGKSVFKTNQAQVVLEKEKMLRLSGIVIGMCCFIFGCSGQSPHSDPGNSPNANPEFAIAYRETIPPPPFLWLDSSEIKFQKEIDVFMHEDSIQFPGKVQVLFTGSSSIRKWEKLADDFPNYTVLNRGFGGSTIRHCTYFAPRIVLPYDPDIIVFYAGENDLAYDDMAPDSLPLHSFREYITLIHYFQPETHIFFLSMKPSPARWKHQKRFEHGNALIKDFIEADPRLHYVDVSTPMLDPSGKPKTDIWSRDKLHMNENGYRIWRGVIAEALEDFLRQEK